MFNFHVLADSSSLSVVYGVFNGAYQPEQIDLTTDEYIELFTSNSDFILNSVTSLHNLHMEEYPQYPFYIIDCDANWTYPTIDRFRGISCSYLILDTFDISSFSVDLSQGTSYSLSLPIKYLARFSLATSTNESSIDTEFSSTDSSVTVFYTETYYRPTGKTVRGDNYFFSNFNLYYSNYSDNVTSIAYHSDLPTYDRLYPISAPIPTAYDYFDFDFLSEIEQDDYTEINLNDYPYVVLSLKDYNNLISPVNFDILGQVCITPVYDYGLKEKPNGITDRCTPNYSSYTTLRYYINNNDLLNNAVFYVSAYSDNLSNPNKIKVNTRVFDISYISSSNAGNPTIYVNGRIYSIIPYSDLTSSAESNEENGFIPGSSCAVGDLNCQANVSGMDISDLFTHPLELLKSMWSAITSIFTVITAFIVLLPVPLQTFMYTAFMFSIILGILKILL